MHLNAPAVEADLRKVSRNGHGNHRVVDHSLHGLVTIRTHRSPQECDRQTGEALRTVGRHAF